MAAFTRILGFAPEVADKLCRDGIASSNNKNHHTYNHLYTYPVSEREDPLLTKGVAMFCGLASRRPKRRTRPRMGVVRGRHLELGYLGQMILGWGWAGMNIRLGCTNLSI